MGHLIRADNKVRIPPEARGVRRPRSTPFLRRPWLGAADSTSSGSRSAVGRLRASAAPARPAGGRERSLGHERLLERAVDVHRSPAGAPLAATASPGATRRPARLTGAPEVEDARRTAEQLRLVDRLVRAGAAEARRPVGRQQVAAAPEPATPPRRRGRTPRPPCRSCTRPRPGAPVAFASPSAKNALERSSRWTCTVHAGVAVPARARAASSASPATRTRARTPPATSSSTRARWRTRGRCRRGHHVSGTSASRSRTCDSASPSASESRTRRATRAVPVSTGIRSRPVAVPMRSIGRIASGHATSPNSPHWREARRLVDA